MKNALLATTALVLSAGVAAADVTISGYGRALLDYQENRAAGLNETQMSMRLRMNIDASRTTDTGIDFGGRIRLQWDQGRTESALSPALLYVSANGLRVEVGNVNTAYDSAALMYESEVGIISRSFGTSRDFGYYSFSSGSYGGTQFELIDGEIRQRVESANRMGVSAGYTIGGVKLMASMVTPDQTTSGDQNEEYSLSASYTMNDIALSAAAVMDAAGREGNDRYFLGAYYTMPGTKNGVGINYTDDGEDSAGNDNGRIITLYGDYEVAPMTRVSAYVANNDKDGNETDNAFGVGVRYDLGGAVVGGSIERGYEEEVRAEAGFRFDF